MKKTLFFLRFKLKNGDSLYFSSYSKRRVLKRAQLWYDVFLGDISFVSCNFQMSGL